MRNWLYAVVGKDRALSIASRQLSSVSIFTVFTLLGSASPAITASPAHQAFTSISSWIELSDAWRIICANQVSVDDACVSLSGFDVSQWHAVYHIPVTSLQILEDDGDYKDLYFGINLRSPGDLWWDRTTFTAPPGHEVYSLTLQGINSRADSWANSKKVVDQTQAAGMYNSFEFDVSKIVHPGGNNVLAMKIIPEQPIPSKPTGDTTISRSTAELGDTRLDWLNWKYTGVHHPKTGFGFTLPLDRNAGVSKWVYHSTSGSVTIRNPYLATVPLPETNPPSLTVYCGISNHSSKPLSGILSGEISRPGSPMIRFQQPVSLLCEETKEISFSPKFPEWTVHDPDQWC